MSRTSFWQLLKPGVVLWSCLLATFPLAIAAFWASSLIGERVAAILFFFPQILFPYDALRSSDASASVPLLTPVGAVGLGMMHWLALTMGFAWLARGRTLPKTIWLALLTMIVSAYAAEWVIHLFGATIIFDGP